MIIKTDDLIYIEQKIKTLTDSKINMIPVEWAEEKRVLPESSPRPGKMSYRDFQYLVEPANRGAPSDPCQIIVGQKGAQVGWTVAVQETNIGYSIEVDPSAMMYVTGNQPLAIDAVKTRIDPMIECSGLDKYIFSQSRKKANKNTGDTATMKEFPGGFFKSGSLQSSATGRSSSCKKLFLDETDSVKMELGHEGAVISTFMRRTNAYENTKKIFLGSTPGEKKTSIVYKEYLKGDQRKYFIPCPKCGHMQFLKWGQFKYEIIDGSLDYESVGYECENDACKYLMKNHEKVNFLPKGEWRPTAKATRRLCHSYHIPSYYSPVGFLSWESIVEQWVEAQESLKNGDILPLKAFVLTIMGEPWEDRGEAPKHEIIMLRRDQYKYQAGEIPEDAIFLNIGADVQGNRIEAELIGWGPRMHSFSINHYVLKCQKDPVTGELENIADLSSSPWKKLENIFTNSYQTKSGRLVKILSGFIDSRYKTTTVKEFCSKMDNVFPCIGEGGKKTWRHPFQLKQIDEAPGVRFNVDTHGLKDHIYTLLRRSQNDDGTYPNGFCFFPTDYPEKYFRQLVAEEKRVTKTKRGNLVVEWAKRPGFERNEALDCRVYAMADLYRLADYVCEENYGLKGIDWPFFWDYMQKEFIS